MKTELKSVLHLYIGCKMRTPNGFRPNGKESTGTAGEAFLTGDLFADIENDTFPATFKPILRPLSDMTEEEKGEMFLLSRMNECIFLLKQGFDLFGLIESGQAIDKTEL